MHHQNIRVLNTLHWSKEDIAIPPKKTESKGKGPEIENEDREGGSQENIQNKEGDIMENKQKNAI